MVSQEYGYDRMAMIANTGFIIAIVDGRGTGFKGRAFRAGVSKQLGKLEAADQIFAARYLGGLKFVDEKRIAIWGWYDLE
jgi:dipeptidyl aminopeptidase/acylaminoacyl peptidase